MRNQGTGDLQTMRGNPTSSNCIIYSYHPKKVKVELTIALKMTLGPHLVHKLLSSSLSTPIIVHFSLIPLVKKDRVDASSLLEAFCHCVKHFLRFSLG